MEYLIDLLTVFEFHILNFSFHFLLQLFYLDLVFYLAGGNNLLEFLKLSRLCLFKFIL